MKKGIIERKIEDSIRASGAAARPIPKCRRWEAYLLAIAAVEAEAPQCLLQRLHGWATEPRQTETPRQYARRFAAFFFARCAEAFGGNPALAAYTDTLR